MAHLQIFLYLINLSFLPKLRAAPVVIILKTPTDLGHTSTTARYRLGKILIDGSGFMAEGCQYHEISSCTLWEISVDSNQLNPDP